MTDGMKWAPGTSYGPIMSQTDLYLLNPKLEIHPILTHSLKSFQLVFNIASGQTGGYNSDATDRDLPFTQKDEVATLPRVTELVIITRPSPWCTIVRNPRGVSLADVCSQLWKDYSDHYVTDIELATLPPTQQDRVRRAALNREAGGMAGWGHAHTAGARCKRIDWLRDRVFFDGLEREDDFAKARLGFSAPNVLSLILTS